MSLMEVTGEESSGAIMEPRMVAANTVSSTGSEVKLYVPPVLVTELRLISCDVVRNGSRVKTYF